MRESLPTPPMSRSLETIEEFLFDQVDAVCVTEGQLFYDPPLISGRVSAQTLAHFLEAIDSFQEKNTSGLKSLNEETVSVPKPQLSQERSIK